MRRYVGVIAALACATAGCVARPATAPAARVAAVPLGQSRGGSPVASAGTRAPVAPGPASVPAGKVAEAPCDSAWCRPTRAGVAVLLPLTGPYRELGAEVRLAIEAAAARDRAEAMFAFYDTAGDPGTAAAVARRAVGDGYGVVLGPLGQRETTAAIAAIEGAALIAHLSPTVAAEPARHVWRWAVGPQDEGAWAVALAEAEDFPTMAVFYPDDETGRVAAASVAASAATSEVTLLRAAVPFAPASATLLADVRVLLGMVPQANADLRRHLAQDRKRGMKTFMPQPGFSLLYVPAAPALGALVAAYLPYHNVELRSERTGDTLALRRKYRGEIPEVVQLVGPSSWAADGFLARAGDAAEGAYLLVPCPGGLSAGSASEQIEGELRGRLGRRPGELAMQAYDAAGMLTAALRANGPTPDGVAGAEVPLTQASLAAITATLARATLADGACGDAAMTAAGNLARTPVILTVRDGAIAPAQW